MVRPWKRILKRAVEGNLSCHSPPQRVFARKRPPAVVALVVPLLGVDAGVVPHQVRLAHKLPVAAVHLARERVLPVLVVRLHVRPVIVAPAEELAAPRYFALVVGLFPRRQPAGAAFRSGSPVLLGPGPAAAGSSGVVLGSPGILDAWFRMKGTRNAFGF